MATILTIQFQAVTPVTGPTTGYTSGGYTAPQISRNTIDSFPFATPFTTATDVGDLSQARWGGAGQSSNADGYTSGGRFTSPPTIFYNTVDRFPFAAPFTTATDSGDLSQARNQAAGQNSDTDGFTSGGVVSGHLDRIDSFPFSVPFTTAADVGNLSQARSGAAGQNSDTNGYTSGGISSSTPFTLADTIDSFPFSNPFAAATDVGNLIESRDDLAGQSSDTSGYTVGGLNPALSPLRRDTIDSFPFSSPFATATDVGNLSQGRNSTTGQSSNTDGYTSGGLNPADPTGPGVTTIDSFPFSSSFTTATDVGDLSQARYVAAGQQG